MRGYICQAGMCGHISLKSLHYPRRPEQMSIPILSTPQFQTSSSVSNLLDVHNAGKPQLCITHTASIYMLFRLQVNCQFPAIFFIFVRRPLCHKNVNIHNFHKLMFNGYQHALKLKQNSQPTKILFGKIQPILWKKWTMMMMMMKDRICR